MLDYIKASRTRETIVSFGWTTEPYPPFLTDLLHSDYHLLGPMKEGLMCKYHASDEEVKTVVMKWLKEHSTEFYEAEIYVLIQR